MKPSPYLAPCVIAIQEQHPSTSAGELDADGVGHVGLAQATRREQFRDGARGQEPRFEPRCVGIIGGKKLRRCLSRCPRPGV